MLLYFKVRGLRKLPTLATGDEALGFWATPMEVFLLTRRQRCWVHKTVNILDKLHRDLFNHKKPPSVKVVMVKWFYRRD